MKGMFDARKNFCNPMYFDLSVYSKATPTPLLKVRSLIKLHCNGKKVRDSCCLSLEGGWVAALTSTRMERLDTTKMQQIHLRNTFSSISLFI